MHTRPFVLQLDIENVFPSVNQLALWFRSAFWGATATGSVSFRNLSSRCPRRRPSTSSSHSMDPQGLMYDLDLPFHSESYKVHLDGHVALDLLIVDDNLVVSTSLHTFCALALCHQNPCEDLVVFPTCFLCCGLVEPHLVFGCEVAFYIRPATPKTLLAVQHAHLRRAIGLGPNCRLSLLSTETRIWPPRFYRRRARSPVPRVGDPGSGPALLMPQ
ncbi:hypothetical protein L227DRAFT_195777 [Lentinus tigrinus ALCF2SS1-6]|uniref:Uncharacterized protein n=1 Tax=Lentinus tigrinus ALCF2SS1-6 TaxID=1328759 RepID=A0A5C2S3J0_9APHY|nr:hypothetical protein L227DRAFT_195777 [Lentinus tigrinus ALCF2SS1-6]